MSHKIAKKFYTSGNTVRLVTYDADALNDTLAPAIYELNFNPMGGYYFTKVHDRFNLPKLYGKVTHRANKILTTYADRDSSTGVLLSGDKGTGKSLLTMLTSNMCVDSGAAVIIIKNPYCGSDFENIINAVPNAVLIFDEFAKVYKTRDGGDNNPQEQLLSFFDGQGAQKRLMLFTENSTKDINEFMLSRPGRIFYHFKYSKLETDVIEEFCVEKAVPEQTIIEIKNYAAGANEFSFDILKAIVEEALRYPTENVNELIKDINIKEPYNASRDFLITSIKDIKGNKYVTLDDSETLYTTSRNNHAYVTVLPDNAELRKAMLDKAQEEFIDIKKEYNDQIPETITIDDLRSYLPYICMMYAPNIMGKGGKDVFVKAPLSNRGFDGLVGDFMVVTSQDAPVKYTNYSALMSEY